MYKMWKPTKYMNKVGVNIGPKLNLSKPLPYNLTYTSTYTTTSERQKAVLVFGYMEVGCYPELVHILFGFLHLVHLLSL